MSAIQIILICLLFIGALVLALFQYGYNRSSPFWNKIVVGLRAISYFIIFLLLLNPLLTIKSNKILKNKLLIAIDNSLSIKENNNDSIVNRLVNDITTRKNLTEAYDIKFYKFGKNIAVLDTLTFDDSETNLSTPLKQLSSLSDNITYPLLLLTDGNQTSGSDVQFTSYSGPIYPVVVGDTTAVQDIKIDIINTNEIAYLNNQFPVEIFINANEKINENKRFVIQNKGKEIFSKEIAFENENSKIITTYIDANEKGFQHYTATIESLANENNTINNAKRFTVNVIENRVRVALVSSIVHPDIGAFKKIIDSDKQFDVSINKPTDKFNVDDIDLFIIYQPDASFSNLFSTLKEFQKNYFIVTGTKTDWTFLNNTQSYFNKKSTNISENISPIYNPNFIQFYTEDIGFASLPPLDILFGKVSFDSNFQPVLFQQIKGIPTSEPMLSTFDNGISKVAVLFGENIWKWRAASYLLLESFSAFDTFFTNLLAYVSSNASIEQLQVYKKPFFYENELIELKATYLDESFQFETKATLWLSIFENGNLLKKIPFRLFNNQYLVTINSLPPGDYNAYISVENSSITKSISLTILPYQIEKIHKQSSYSSLKTLAEKTGGKIYFKDTYQQLIDFLISSDLTKKTIVDETKTISIIEWKILFFILIMTLSTEWFIRKYHGRV